MGDIQANIIGTDRQGRLFLRLVLLPKVGFLARVVLHITLAEAQGVTDNRLLPVLLFFNYPYLYDISVGNH